MLLFILELRFFDDYMSLHKYVQLGMNEYTCFERVLSEKLGKMLVYKILVKCRNIIDFGLNLKRQAYVATHIFIVAT